MPIMSDETADEGQMKRQKKFDHLNKMAANFTALSTFGVIALGTGRAILTAYGSSVLEDVKEVLDAAESCFPPVDEVFTEELFRKPLILITILHNVCKFYDVSPVTDDLLRELNVGEL